MNPNSRRAGRAASPFRARLRRAGALGLVLIALGGGSTSLHAQDSPQGSPPTSSETHHPAGLCCADGHLDTLPPITVMGDHTHHAGGWMFSYRAMVMRMDGLRDGTDSLSRAEVLASYPVTPTEMTMEMHMLGAMHALDDDHTIALMVPYIRNSMDHVTGTGVRFTTESEGVGDVSITGLRSLVRTPDTTIVAGLGLSLPTGDIEVEDDTPAAADADLPYPMRLGSGTFDLKPSLTWSALRGEWGVGAQAKATVHLGRNDEGYSLGDAAECSVWGTRGLGAGWSSSLRLRASTWADIDGDDDDLNPNMVATADPGLRSGTRVEVGLGVRYSGQGSWSGHSIALEWALPIHRDLDGPQLELDSTVTLGWQVSW